MVPVRARASEVKALMPRRNKPHAIMPIENRTLMYLDPDSEMELEVGQMRFWIDMVKAGEDYVAFDFEGLPGALLNC